MPSSWRSRINWLALAVVFVALGTRVLACFVAESDWDEYAFALVGRDILAGKVPYSGVYDNKPVGLYYLFAASERLFGPGLLAIRLLALGAAATTAFVLYKIVRRLASDDDSKLLPLMTAAVFLALSLSNGGLSAMSELLASPLVALVLAAGVAWAQRKLGTRAFCLVAGTALGVACQISYLTIPLTGFLMAGFAIAACRRGEALAQIAVALTLSLAAFAGTFGLILVPQALSGDLADYFRMQLHYHESYRVAAGFIAGLKGFAAPVAKFLPPLVIAVLARLFYNRRVRLWPSGELGQSSLLLSVFGLAGALIAALAAGRYYGHYFLSILPFFGILTALVLLELAPERRLVPVVLVLAVALGYAARAGHMVYDNGRHPYFADQVATFLKTHTRPQDRIFVFNENHAIYYPSGRPAATRFVFAAHYLEKPSADALGINLETFLDEALASRPAAVVLGGQIKGVSSNALMQKLHDGHYQEATVMRGPENWARIFLISAQ